MEEYFYIGQKVVAIKDHSLGDYKIGDEFTILDMKTFCCYVGINFEKLSIPCITHCPDCNIHHNNLDGFYYDQKNFAPLGNLSNMSFEDAIKLVTKKELTV